MCGTGESSTLTSVKQLRLVVELSASAELRGDCQFEDGRMQPEGLVGMTSRQKRFQEPLNSFRLFRGELNLQFNHLQVGNSFEVRNVCCEDGACMMFGRCRNDQVMGTDHLAATR